MFLTILMKPRILLLFLMVFLFFGCVNDSQSENQVQEQNEDLEGEVMEELKITSSVFENNAKIPSKYTCDGENVNPSLKIENIPQDAVTLVLIMDDPDAPGGTWDHWIVFNIPTNADIIEEDSIPGVQGKNSWGKNNYGGPCPPSGVHRYFFKVYALGGSLTLEEGATKDQIENAMQEHVLAKGEIIGLYSRN